MIRLKKFIALCTVIAVAGVMMPVMGNAHDAFADEEAAAVPAETEVNAEPETVEQQDPAEETVLPEEQQPDEVQTESVPAAEEEAVVSEEPQVEAEAVKETTIKDVSTKHSKSYKSSISDTVTVSPAYGRTVQLYLYDQYMGKWVLQKTYTAANTNSADITITYPNVWKAYYQSKWKIVCPETDDYDYASATVTISNKIGSAKAAVVIDAATGEVIYAQNARQHRKIASMTKMVTMMVVADRAKMSKKVKISSEAVKARKKSGGMGLRKGDVVKMNDLVHATLMESANDAAAAAACGVSGKQSKFAVLMRNKAKSIGATDSTFKYAYGDWHSKTYSTAYDQALIGREFMTNPKYSKLRKIVKKKTYKFKTKKKKKRYTVRMGGMSTSLIRNGRSIGIKSGYNPPAGYCYANAWKYKGRLYISVVMGATSSKKLVSSQKALMSFSDYSTDHRFTRIKVK